jgi:hypothetical protein
MISISPKSFFMPFSEAVADACVPLPVFIEMAAGALFEIAVEGKPASQLHGKAHSVFKPGIVKGVGEGQAFITGIEVDGAVAAEFMVHIGLQVNDGIRIHLTSQVEARPAYETGDTGLLHPGAVVHFI